MWDPYLFTDIQSIEKVQRCAAQWVLVLSDYNRFSSVINDLQWPSLSSCRKFARLSTFYMITHHLSMPSLLQCFLPIIQSTHHHTSFHYNIIPPSLRINSYKHSFFPRTINEWTNLPANAIESNSLSYNVLGSAPGHISCTACPLCNLNLNLRVHAYK